MNKKKYDFNRLSIDFYFIKTQPIGRGIINKHIVLHENVYIKIGSKQAF